MNKTQSISLSVALSAAIFLMACASPVESESQSGITEPLQFKQDGTFKIAQFTDIHLHTDTPGEPEKTREIIEYVLKSEKPDLSVLTGDIVNSPAPEGWEFIAAIFGSSGIPWAVTLGNHDDEDQWSREQIFEFLEKQEGFVGISGPDISGVGNYLIPLQSASTSETAALLYFLDSHGYPKNAKRGSYDWVKFDQINWYRTQSTKLTQTNHNTPYPALAFFHIPVPEFLEVVGNETYMGIKEEGVASPEINTGLFAAFVEMQDVMGAFVGHDHYNNYIGILQDVALAFGQTSGYGGYGDFAKGARIIELREGEYAFNTWITTQEGISFEYNYPSGMAFNVELSNARVPVSPSGELKQGLQYRYFEGKFKSTSDMLATTPKRTGTISNFDISGADVKDHFGFEFTGYIKIPRSGYYRFYTFSDDGSVCYIGDSLVVDNDGSHSLRRREATIALTEGFHPIRVVYFEDYMGEKLEVGISGLTIKETPIRDEMVFHEMD
ncbi:MAG: metallophosphoesterase [Lunatimonas sp.]|uniref:PA14 domain-containing protein n=1 Tax=Lunatimonas sp. TaxID=2060141 RepID=UPI00263BD62A|nr:PA14 domain-containing protein [Lunatimonas sp.]MCC5937050.1 metallophosphoesterase [Lunatimonas sp.]